MHRGSEFNLPIRSARERPNPDSAFHRTASRGPPASLPHPDRPVKDRLRWRASVGHFTLWGISFTEGAHPACSASHARGEIPETSASRIEPVRVSRIWPIEPRRMDTRASRRTTCPPRRTSALRRFPEEQVSTASIYSPNCHIGCFASSCLPHTVPAQMVDTRGKQRTRILVQSPRASFSARRTTW